ncbi:MAG: hypothetical protein ACRD9Q_05155 [Nitrososphaeraceae archaeon]
MMSDMRITIQEGNQKPEFHYCHNCGIKLKESSAWTKWEADGWWSNCLQCVWLTAAAAFIGAFRKK